MNYELIPDEGKLWIKMEEVKAGALVTSSRESATEVAEVLAVASDIEDYKKGDKILVKAWAIDNGKAEEQKFQTVMQSSGGIMGKLKKMVK